MRYYPKAGIKTIEGLIITHAHMDAIGGCDDLRDVQILKKVFDDEGKFKGWLGKGPLPIYTDPHTGSALTKMV